MEPALAATWHLLQQLVGIEQPMKAVGINQRGPTSEECSTDHARCREAGGSEQRAGAAPTAGARCSRLIRVPARQPQG